MTRTDTHRPTAAASSLLLAGLLLALAFSGALPLMPAGALMAPGTPGRDVHIGTDDDTASNRFVQPAGVKTPQHMNGTDVLVGRGGGDLLVGNLGGDTLLGNAGRDVLVGGPEHGRRHSADVLLGETGDDVAVWAPGDGSDAFVGYRGRDTMVMAPLVLRDGGTPLLARTRGRMLPQVRIDEQQRFTCRVDPVPASEGLGFDHLVRFEQRGRLVGTVRLEAVETVYCPSPETGRAVVADLTEPAPRFRTVRLDRVGGLVGAIVDPVA